MSQYWKLKRSNAGWFSSPFDSGLQCIKELANGNGDGACTRDRVSMFVYVPNEKRT